MKIKKEEIKKIILALNKHWQKFWFHYFCAAVIVAGLLIYYIFRAILPSPVELIKKDKTLETAIGENTEVIFRHPLTGEIVGAETVRPSVFGVMVENSAEAWPLFGIEAAFLVVEAPVEAKIPRLLAFYYDGQIVEKIGPVRSARPYYLDWAGEFGALYAHVGGSPAAMELIQNNKEIFDLNEFWNSDLFWRSATRLAPHNTYTSTELLEKALKNFLKDDESLEIDYGLWSFKEDKPATEIETDLSLNSTEPLYQVTWKYNSEKNYYERWKTDGGKVVSGDGDEIVANNVAVIYTSIEIIDEVGRREIQTIGEGEALILQDGRKIPAVWKKESAAERLRFFFEDGKEVTWNAGKIWIEVISILDKNN
jgi:hypothetical protein